MAATLTASIAAGCVTAVPGTPAASSPPGVATAATTPGPTSASTPPSQPTASAGNGTGSIVYMSGSNVWIAAPDGSAARQLTTDGTDAAGYHDPTQSDAGLVYAVHGTSTLVSIDRAGGGATVVANLPTLENGAEGLAASPDGTYLAYTTTGYGQTIDPRFGTPNGTFIYGGIDIATTDGKSVPGAAQATLIFPTWASNASIVAADGVDVWFDTVGQPAEKWLDESNGCVIDLDCPSGQSAAANMSSPAISRNGMVLAYSLKPYFGAAGRQFAEIQDAPPAVPMVRCLVPDQQDFNDAGSFAPDARAFAYDDTRFDPTSFETTVGRGIYVFPVKLDAADCGASAAKLILPGGQQPDWGPAAP
jgi:hypothetical protein